MDWHTSVARELQAAEQARRQGNEGRARVSARRAAGIVAEIALQRSGIDTHGLTAFARLRRWQQEAEPGTRLHTVLEHLTRRVDTAFSLPDDIDLLAEVRWLAQQVAD